MAEQANAEKSPQDAKRRLPLKSLAILAAIMVLEGGFFAAWMALAGPSAAGAASDSAVAARLADEEVEHKVLEFRAPNWKSGRAVYYQLTISVVCREADVQLLEAKCGKRMGQIQDSLRAIIAKADPELFREEDLTTLKRQIFAMLEELAGEGLIKSVLIPEYDSYRDS